ncbi:hypothetical protein BASA60_004104 [Batrachochytrium salamandrivorans]|nr:hypothetical protein BASA62_010098 [Batrachochytrium salamandrivorans]KAH6577276.1 hypothetical protein BASA60_004104 [Batrachochytrium salamandrivorans]
MPSQCQFSTAPLARSMLKSLPQVSSYTIQNFKEEYPIICSRTEPPTRVSSFSIHADKPRSWWDITLFGDFERRVSSFLAKVWVNGKVISSGIELLEKEGNSTALNPLLAVSSDQIHALSEYLPDTFLAGAELAITSFMHALPKDVVGEPNLESMCKHELYNAFQTHHRQLQDLGIALSVEVKSLKDLQMRNVWLAFGSSQHLQSTLDSGEIVQSFGPLSFIRQRPNSRIVTLQKGCFSYTMPIDELEASASQDEVDREQITKFVVPSATALNSIMGRGFIVGIDVAASISMTISMHKAEPESGTSPLPEAVTTEDRSATHPSPPLASNPLWSHTIDREMIIRFETQHCKGAFKHDWRIADVDNLLASK